MSTPTSNSPAAPVPVTIAENVVRASACQEAAGRIANLPQDYELDPGRGDAVQLLNRMAADAHQPGTYPPALPWARLLDAEDLAEFFRNLDAAMRGAARDAHLAAKPQSPAVLEAFEKTCASWRATAEAQHAHNYAPGPGTDEDRTVAYSAPGTGYLYCLGCCHGGGLFAALTSDDLPEGGLCDGCGGDVLIPQTPADTPAHTPVHYYPKDAEPGVNTPAEVCAACSDFNAGRLVPASFCSMAASRMP
ncbi:hypothetical protein [Streptomyces sp. CCM_MD2014]|uniref:hypothetical protein n=1 Tax=Streptomyces sp. CCM_MD2014 TaxID=1561022 RepID=UPI00052AC09C|nr:hypothetical protein [Streptomyces sp. CCM_MD2014]AIV35562.1 hypothetical protein NI25_20360 [Streptomyces sp. CCM_MD2014]